VRQQGKDIDVPLINAKLSDLCGKEKMGKPARTAQTPWYIGEFLVDCKGIPFNEDFNL
jgi:hypothetical protein